MEMVLQDLKIQIIEIIKELKKDISKFQRFKLNRKYNKIIKLIKDIYKGGIY